MTFGREWGQHTDSHFVSVSCRAGGVLNRDSYGSSVNLNVGVPEAGENHGPQHFLNLWPLPQGQGWLRPTKNQLLHAGRYFRLRILFLILSADLHHPGFIANSLHAEDFQDFQPRARIAAA